MKILMSHLPKSNWWGRGTPVYENNWSMTLGKIPDAEKTKKEHNLIIEAIQKYTELEILPFPTELDTQKQYKHDAVFVRDSFISNQKGDIVMSNYTARERQLETEHLKKYLKQNGFKLHYLTENANAEGGEFYYIANGNILFAGRSRNNIQGIKETATYLKSDSLCIVISKAYHLDTVFTVLLNKQGKLIGMIACLELIQNMREVMDFAQKMNVALLEINQEDSIGYDGKGTIAVNSLPLPGVLIGGGIFKTPGIEERLIQMNIKHSIAPSSQFHLSGGGVHCLTNELLL